MLAKNDGDSAMSRAASIAQRLVVREEQKTRSRMQAYQSVASNVGRSASWLRDLIGGRVKSVAGEIERRLDALLIRGLEAEIARLSHELEMARQSGVHAASDHMAEVETLLARARALMEGGK